MILIYKKIKTVLDTNNDRSSVAERRLICVDFNRVVSISFSVYNACACVY